ncbi:snurportin-1-like [Glandiceps talaboti]
MEELTASLAASFNVTNIPNNPAAPHPRLLNYKVKTSVDQDDRRKNKLEQQKRKRFDYVNHARRLADDDWKDYVSDEEEEDDDGDGEQNESMDTSKPKQKHRKRKRYYKNQLMLSEWLVEVPSDFQQEWVMVLCPVGKRSLVVAARGKTSAYARNGFKVNQFPSLLPGGNRRHSCKYAEYTLIDCIYSEASRTFYILDMMCWRGVPIYDSETDFRFYWMQTKLEEIPELANHSSINPYNFLPLPFYTCDKASLEKVMAEPLPFEVQLDGLLFYHKKTHYTFGSTPLVGWLQAWMLPDILDVPVPQSYIDNRPPNARLLPPSPMEVKSDNNTQESTDDGKMEVKVDNNTQENTESGKMDNNTRESTDGDKDSSTQME